MRTRSLAHKTSQRASIRNESQAALAKAAVLGGARDGPRWAIVHSLFDFVVFVGVAGGAGNKPEEVHYSPPEGRGDFNPTAVVR